MIFYGITAAKRASSFVLSRYTLSSCVAAVMLSGCGGSQPPIGAPGAMPQSRAIATRADRGGSWMLPEAKSEDLLYISNSPSPSHSSAWVTVYSYPRGKLVGAIKGFYDPVGECVDRAGNVFIADLDTLYEYKHGGERPIQKLTLPNYFAVDCSVDPTTDNLAVTWNQSASSPNYVGVYRHASGTPTLYSVSGAFLFYCSYDNSGNLFVDGQLGYGSQDAVFVELPMGASKLKTITLDQSFEHVGAVQWDGKYVAVGDDVAQKIYRFAISGKNGTLMGTVDLGTARGIYLCWIKGNRVVCSDSSGDAVRYWNYPAGGPAIKSITQGVRYPYGATISAVPK